MRISDWSSDVCSSDLFFSGYKGNILHDWIIYDPRELVNLVDQYATEDGIAFDPAVRSASASSVIDEKVRAAYVMASLDTEVGGMPLAINAGVRRSEGRRVGKECVSPGRPRWAQ